MDLAAEKETRFGETAEGRSAREEDVLGWREETGELGWTGLG